eukprot:COSAG01_NODE_5709_length_4085_cov_4.072002_2_plen_53_part_00
MHAHLPDAIAAVLAFDADMIHFGGGGGGGGGKFGVAAMYDYATAHLDSSQVR